MAAVLLGAALTLAGCAAPAPAPDPRPARTRPAAPQKAVDALLATALQRYTEGNVSQALAAAAAAAEQAPRRADVAWLHARLCTAMPGCQPEPLDTRLRTLDPGNAAAWLGALSNAQGRQDRAAEDQILAVMGQSERFDVYWNSIVARSAVALGQATAQGPQDQRPPGPAGPLTEGLEIATGWMSALAAAALRPVTDACGPRRLAERAQRCARVAEVLRRGDSWLVEGIGLGIGERVYAAGTAGAKAVAEQIRRSRYQRDLAGELITAQIEKEKFSKELIELMFELPREQDVFLAILRWAGQPLEPPPGWAPPASP